MKIYVELIFLALIFIAAILYSVRILRKSQSGKYQRKSAPAPRAASNPWNSLSSGEDPTL